MRPASTFSIIQLSNSRAINFSEYLRISQKNAIITRLKQQGKEQYGSDSIF